MLELTHGPALTAVRTTGRPTAQVLVLHGGTQRSTQPVDGRSLAWRRGQALARAVASGLGPAEVDVSLLRYRVKGWNADDGPVPSPVNDTRWALRELAIRRELPVVLVGHSMGARTAVAVADHLQVVGVVALAGWLPAGEPIDALVGKVLRVGHGRRDRITSFRAASTFVQRAQSVADAEFTDLGARGHYLLRGVRGWNSFATNAIAEVLRRH